MASNQRDPLQPLNIETPETLGASDAKAATPTEGQPASVNRRSMFGVGAVGIAALVAAACGSGTFSSASAGKKKTNAKPKADAGDGDDDDDSGSTSGATKGGTKGGTGTGGGPRIDPTTGELYIPAGGTETVPGGEKGLKECVPKDVTVVTCDPKTGKLTALKPGDTTVTVTLPDGTKKEIPVKVYDPKNPPKTLPAPTPGTTDDTGDDVTGVVDEEDKCTANNMNKLDVESMDDMPADMVPKVVFYGTKRSALVAIQFSSHDKVKQVIICRDDGQLLALHGITGADGSNRPIVCDNLWIGDSANIKIVVQNGDERWKSTHEVKWFKSFGGKTVTDLTDGAKPALQAIAVFGENGPTFGVDNDTRYPDENDNAADDRPLITAKTGSKWAVQAATLNGGQCTDIMGNPISIADSGLLEYQVFCVYVNDGGNLFRTILHVG